MPAWSDAPLVAVARNELRRGARRPAPYVVALLFAGNAALWSLAGPAAARGWVVNGDISINHMISGFVFGVLPLFAAILLADAVLRDEELGVTSLILATRTSRDEYVLGKFAGAVVVLLVATIAFPLTMFVLQPSPMRIAPYVTQYGGRVVFAALLMGAVAFAIGTRFRSAKLAYGAVIVLYPVYPLLLRSRVVALIVAAMLLAIATRAPVETGRMRIPRNAAVIVLASIVCLVDWMIGGTLTLTPLVVVTSLLAIFTTGEAMHRDRELGVEPLVFATPVSNTRLLLHRALPALTITMSVIAIVMIVTRSAPVIAIAAATLVIALSLLLHVLIRNKHVVYAISVAALGAYAYLGPREVHPAIVLAGAVVVFAVAVNRFRRIAV